MPETIESFVAKLQAEGVDAGRQEGDKLRSDAQADADRIIAEAKAQAEKILADARTEADNALTRGKTELALAARDTMLKLQEAVNKALQGLVAAAIGEPMADTAFIGKLLHEVIMLYVKDLQEHKEVMGINVPESMRQELSDWAMREIGQAVVEGVRGSVDVRSTLATAGFEYTVSGATVEVTPDSVTQSLTELLTPALREVLSKAAQASD
ncbi:MAG: hypothetical protein ACYS8X_13350 [Planctomycetota bacterium]|jgi:V/A-type H+-transporting ATPase subunit E